MTDALQACVRSQHARRATDTGAYALLCSPDFCRLSLTGVDVLRLFALTGGLPGWPGLDLSASDEVGRRVLGLHSPTSSPLSGCAAGRCGSSVSDGDLLLSRSQLSPHCPARALTALGSSAAACARTQLSCNQKLGSGMEFCAVACKREQQAAATPLHSWQHGNKSPLTMHASTWLLAAAAIANVQMRRHAGSLSPKGNRQTG